MVIFRNNHGPMVMRRALASKMSRRFIKSYNDILEVNEKWGLKDKHVIEYKGKRILFAHQFCKKTFQRQ